jgi:hypothetical protein
MKFAAPSFAGYKWPNPKIFSISCYWWPCSAFTGGCVSIQFFFCAIKKAALSANVSQLFLLNILIDLVAGESLLQFISLKYFSKN